MIFKKEPKICFVHVPRSAGTSIRRYLEQIFTREAILEFYKADKIALARDGKRKSLFEQYRAYTGHFDYRTFRAILPRRTRYITMLRDPVERIISLYYFWRSYRPDFAQAHIVYPDGPRLARELSLKEFLRCKENVVAGSIVNLQARQLGGCLQNPLSRINFERVVKKAVKTLKRMDFFGITEEFKSSMTLLHRTFGWQEPAGYIAANSFSGLGNRPHAFVKVERDQEITEEVRALLFDLTEADRRVYDIAREMFEKRCDAASRSWVPVTSFCNTKTVYENTGILSQYVKGGIPLKRNSTDATAEIDSLKREIERLHAAIRSIHRSASWRISRPLRLAGCMIKSAALLLSRENSASGLLKKGWKVLRTYGLNETKARLRRSLETRNAFKQCIGESSPPFLPVPKGMDLKTYFYRMCELQLDVFLKSGSSMTLPHSNAPLVSIIIVTFNKAPLTYTCLRSIAECREVPVEVIIVDNASVDRTRELMSRLHDIRPIMNERNEHYLHACRRAATEAAGKYLLFLNNDIQLFPGSIESAAAVLEEDDTIGAVGGRLFRLDGTLQEAGCMVFRDGHCKGYGRGDDPFAPPYSFRRDVDFCSGAFLLTRRDLYERLGGLDENFAPAYYEDVDYCLRVQELGYRIVYEPSINAFHYEFGSSRPEEAKKLMERNRSIFVKKHADRLSRSQPSSVQDVNIARHVSRNTRSILYIDDRIPHVNLGSGFPRSNAILKSLQHLGCITTFFPTVPCPQSWESVYTDVPREVEVIVNGTRENLLEFLEERNGSYDAIFVSRPHNMELLQRLFEKNGSLNKGIPVIYDAEAIYALREIERRKLLGPAPTEKESRVLIEEELSLARTANNIVTVSVLEKKHFIEKGFTKVFVLGHTITTAAAEVPFGKRKGFLFIGAMHDEISPNADAVIWFANEVLPRIHRKLNDRGVPFYIVGFNKCEKVWALADDTIQVTGTVENLRPYYEAARVFVAPTRFGAGVPLKIYEACAHGIPVVTTRLCERQLGWNSPAHLLAAETGAPEDFADCCVRLYSDAELWSSVRTGGMHKATEECSQEKFTASLGRILEETGERVADV